MTTPERTKYSKWRRIIDSWPLGDSYGEWRGGFRYWPLDLNRSKRPPLNAPER